MFLGIHFIFTLSFIVLIESGVMEDSQGVVDRTAVLSGHEMKKRKEEARKSSKKEVNLNGTTTSFPPNGY